jgi:hypothetical protein
MKKMPIILDTDIGGDIDDVLALAYLLNSLEADLLAVTTVNTDPSMRARIAAKVLRVYGRRPIRLCGRDTGEGGIRHTKTSGGDLDGEDARLATTRRCACAESTASGCHW